MEIGQTEQQFEQTGTLFRRGWSLPRKERYGKIALLGEPIERAGIGQLSLLEALLHRGNAGENLIQVMHEANAMAGECGRDGRGASADTADSNLGGHNHTSPKPTKEQP